MSYNGVVVAGNEVAESFAQFFENKVSKIVNSSQIYQNVYNRRTKMFTVGSDFMTAININIYKCVNQLKLKNCEGNDRIPQKTLFFKQCFRLLFTYPPLVAGRLPDRKRAPIPKTPSDSKGFVTSDQKITTGRDVQFLTAKYLLTGLMRL